MKITCLHGYFIFRATRLADILKFNSLYRSVSLVAKDDYYTFEELVDAPIYSIAGNTYLGAAATVTYAGQPWEVMEQNQLVYDYSEGEVRHKSEILVQVLPDKLQTHFLSKGLIIPGSATKKWDIITGYQCMFDSTDLTFNYSELFYA